MKPVSAIVWSWLVLLAAIWAPVVYLLGAQWSLYAEYQYGWAVPFLCLYLAWKRTTDHRPLTTDLELGATDDRLRTTDGTARHLTQSPHPQPLSHPLGEGSIGLSPVGAEREAKSSRRPVVLLVAFALVYWFMRVLQEANPVWRLASYGLASAAVALTLLSVYLTQGRCRAAHFGFPVCFFLVAVPWPTPVEEAVIQTLTRFNAAAVVEVLSFAGAPALLHGNVIEISAGMVGIDEACSGIRSFQATLMIALFFGEFYRLRWCRRWWLLAAGPALALLFNFMRTLVLVSVAARAGLPAMEKWHDPTGVALLLGCFFCLWGVAVWLAKGRVGRVTPCAPPHPSTTSSLSIVHHPSSISPITLCVGLLIWSILVQISTEAWFRSHEDRGGHAFSWVARWPGTNPTLRTKDIPQTARAMLQCDQSTSASWTDDAGVSWQAFFLRWLPAGSFYGRAKVALSKSHNPAICLTASGMKMESQLDSVSLRVRPDFNLIFDRFVFATERRELYVFFAQTEDMEDGGQASLRSTHLARLRAALAGSRNYGQINFEVAITGPESADAALRIFSARLPDLIESQPTRKQPEE